MAFPFGTRAVATSPSQQSAAAVGQLSIDQAVEAVRQEAQAQRPVRTLRAYNAKQNEFLDYVQRTLPGEISAGVVTENKLVAFLHREVIGRETRKGGKGRVVGVQTIRQYVSAITDLWNQQKGAGMNTHPSPRGAAVKAIIRTAMTNEYQRQRTNLDDPGKGTMLDGYTTVDELGQLARFFFDKDSPVGHRDRLALLLCHSGMLRSDEVRNIEYSHIQCHDMQQLLEGETRCVAYQIVLRQGKANQINNIQYASFLRAKDVEACPVSALGFYLFERFMMGRDSYPPDNCNFPNLSKGEYWYQIKLLKGSSNDLQKTMDYTVHKQACEAAYAACGWHFDKKTHAMRGSACRMADIGGASEANIKRAGRWEQGACEISYLKTMPKEAMRALAGFHPNGGDFFIARAAVEPPASLKTRIFPELEDWEEDFSKLPPQHRSLAASGFIRTLKELRTVILQDAVLLRQSHPSNYIWDHPIFQLPAFNEYEKKLQEVMQDQPLPVEMKLRQAMPDLIAHIQSADAAVLAAVKDLKYDNTDISRRLDEVTRCPMSSVQLLKEVTTPGNLQVVFKGSSPASSSAGTEDEVLAGKHIDSSKSSNYSPYSLPGAQPAFSMSRQVASISDAWLEYDIGLGGRPSVRQSYEEGGVKGWKANDTERRFYDRRMTLISFIKQQADLKKISPEDLASFMEARRLELPAKERSLAKIQERIKAGKAADLVSFVSH